MVEKSSIKLERVIDIQHLKHGDRVVLMENGRRLVEGVLVGVPWASGLDDRGAAGRLRSSVSQTRDAVSVRDTVSLISVVTGESRRPSSKQQDFRVLGGGRDIHVYRVPSV